MVGCLLVGNPPSGLRERVLAVCAIHFSVVEPGSEEVYFVLPEAGVGARLAEVVREVAVQSGLQTTAGAGPSKLVARLAAEERPGGVVEAGEEAKFLARFPVARLAPHLERWSEGGEAAADQVIRRLEELGLYTIGLLQEVPVSFLASRFGPLGKVLHQLAFGRDCSPVRPLYPPPVLEARLSLPGGVEGGDALELALHHLAGELAGQLRSRGERAGEVTLILEPEEGPLSLHTLRSGVPIADQSGIFLAAQRLLGRVRVEAPVVAVSLQLSGLERAPQVQSDLWGEQARGREPARRRLSRALAAVRRRFGTEGACWAAELEIPRRERVLALLGYR